MVTFSGREGSETRVSTTPASEIAEIARWRRDPTRKCCPVGSHARPSGKRFGERKLMTWGLAAIKVEIWTAKKRKKTVVIVGLVRQCLDDSVDIVDSVRWLC